MRSQLGLHRRGRSAADGSPAPYPGGKVLGLAVDLGEGTVTLTGGPARFAFTLTVTYQVDSSGLDVDREVEVAPGDTAAAIATAAAAAIDGNDGLSAAAEGGVATIALDTASSLDALSAVLV